MNKKSSCSWCGFINKKKRADYRPGDTVLKPCKKELDRKSQNMECDKEVCSLCMPLHCKEHATLDPMCHEVSKHQLLSHSNSSFSPASLIYFFTFFKDSILFASCLLYYLHLLSQSIHQSNLNYNEGERLQIVRWHNAETVERTKPPPATNMFHCWLLLLSGDVIVRAWHHDSGKVTAPTGTITSCVGAFTYTTDGGTTSPAATGFVDNEFESFETTHTILEIDGFAKEVQDTLQSKSSVPRCPCGWIVETMMLKLNPAYIKLANREEAEKERKAAAELVVYNSPAARAERERRNGSG